MGGTKTVTQLRVTPTLPRVRDGSRVHVRLPLSNRPPPTPSHTTTAPGSRTIIVHSSATELYTL